MNILFKRQSMEKDSTKNNLNHFLLFLYMAFLASIVFSFRAISSISIGLILITSLFRYTRIIGSHFPQKALTFFLIGCCLLFLIQCIALTYTHNIWSGIHLLERDSGLIFIPLAVFCSNSFLTIGRYRKLSFYFAGILCIGALYCIVIAAVNYFSGLTASVFFYHDLVKPLSQHAIRFSIMVFIALIFLVENLKQGTHHPVNALFFFMIALLSFFLVLLSSKLIISFYIIYLFYSFFSKKFYKTKSILFIAVFIIAFIITVATPNPVGNRFRVLFTGNSLLFTQKNFNPRISFNGLQFRLLEWRYTYEIIKEQRCWLSGVTPGDAQSFLDKKYIETNMYTGVPGTEQRGFLGYHTHNQLLQALLENGLPALIIFLFICYALFRMAGASKSKELKWLGALLFVYCFTDAPFETQYGLVIFTFFPVFFYIGNQSLSNYCLHLKKHS